MATTIEKIKFFVNDINDIESGDVVGIQHSHTFSHGTHKDWSTSIYEYKGYGSAGSLGSGYIFQSVAHKHTKFVYKEDDDSSRFIGKLIN